MQVRFLGGEDPLEEGMATHPSILAGESHGQKSLAGYSPRGLKESDTCEATEHTCIHTHMHIYIYKTQNSKILFSFRPVQKGLFTGTCSEFLGLKFGETVIILSALKDICALNILEIYLMLIFIPWEIFC